MRTLACLLMAVGFLGCSPPLPADELDSGRGPADSGSTTAADAAADSGASGPSADGGASDPVDAAEPGPDAGKDLPDEPDASAAVADAATRLPPGLTRDQKTSAASTRVFDVFMPTAQPQSAVVFLHGGGGKKESIEEGLELTPVSQARLDQLGVAWVFPQGLAAAGNSFTWENYVMTSGTDDVAFLTELAAWVRTRLGVAKVTLSGHSNGGIMTHRIWCEAGTLFDRYLPVAGPASVHFRPSGGAACPGTKPIFAIVGDGDLVLQTPGNLSAPTWTIAPFFRLLSAAGTFVDPDVLNEFLAHKSVRMAALCPGEALAAPVETTRRKMYSGCGGKVVTWLVKAQETPTGIGNHAIGALEQDGAFTLTDELATWAKQ